MNQKTENREEIVEVDYRFELLLTHCAGYKQNLERLMFVTIEVVDHGSVDNQNLRRIKIVGR